MDAPDEAPHPAQDLGVFEFRGAPGTAGIHGKPVTAEVMQGLPVSETHRRDHGNLPLGQFRYEFMLFPDRLVAPPARPIELRHQRRRILAIHLVDAVFIAVERKQAAVARQADALQRIEHAVGREARIRRGRLIFHAPLSPVGTISVGARNASHAPQGPIYSYARLALAKRNC